ncbi:MAG: hypothetical protein JW913_14515 [Chitinispirillaceae bacterium]|nr:hypothetical protein [Chitinispirillaceae bacterium]
MIKKYGSPFFLSNSAIWKPKTGYSQTKGEQNMNVTGMSDEELCPHEMFVDIEWSGRAVAVSLELLKPVKFDRKTVEA